MPTTACFLRPVMSTESREQRVSFNAAWSLYATHQREIQGAALEELDLDIQVPVRESDSDCDLYEIQ